MFDFYKEGRLYDYVITVYAESKDRCPLFPGVQRRLHWPFPDPSALEGTHGERLARSRAIRDAIREKVRSWVEES